MSRVLNVILSHQPQAEIERLLAWWSSYVPLENILLTYGGPEAEFAKLSSRQSVFIPDPQLRIKDKPRAKCNYRAVFEAATRWLEKSADADFTHVHFAEFDHLPLVHDLPTKLVQRLKAEDADVLGHGLRRVDGSSNVQYLYHVADPEFSKFWSRISVRADKNSVFHMLVSGSFWKRQAFMDVGAQQNQVPVYMELHLGTLAHHLGFRVRPFGEQTKSVSTVAVPGLSIEKARELGCWTIHPVKSIPSTNSESLQK